MSKRLLQYVNVALTLTNGEILDLEKVNELKFNEDGLIEITSSKERKYYRIPESAYIKLEVDILSDDLEKDTGNDLLPKLPKITKHP